MIKRDITETVTVYEYDKEGKLLKKTVTETHTETHEEEDNTVTTYPSWSCLNGTPDVIPCTLTTKTSGSDSISTTTTG